MSSKKKLFYIDQLVGPTSLDIINALNNYYEVHLYTGGIIKTYAELDPSVIVHNRIAYNKKNNFTRIATWCFYYLTTIPVIFFRRKNEFFLVSNPPLNFFIGYVFWKMFSIRFSLLLFDIYPDILIQSGHLSPDSYLARKWIALNKLSFTHAHRIFTISENLAKEVSKYLPNDKSNLKVVPNWVDSEEIKPVPKDDNPFLHQLGIQDKLIVMYSGNMGQTHDLETIVEAARLLADQPDIQFLMIGDGTKKPKIIRMIDELKLTNVQVLPFQEPEIFRYSIACADVGFVTLSDGFEAYSVPSKTYYLMAAGCVVFAIANEKSELNSLLTKYNFGLRFDPGSAQVVAREILNIFRNRELLLRLKTNAREAAAHFTHENAKTIAREVFA